jgi:uncharacterized membrane protein YraQ (UPF0718 family)
VLFYLIFGLLIVTVIGLILQLIKANKQSFEIKSIHQQHAVELASIQKEHCDVLEKIRLEMLKREEEKSRQWIESEKETLHVLNGVSTLLDLSDKFGRIESEKIIQMLEEIQEKINKYNSHVKKN